MKHSVLMVAVSLSLALCVSPAQAAEPLQDVNDRALPDFSLASVASGKWQPDSLQGKPWIINFWATWCPPCVEEIPSMNAAWEILKPQGVGMLAINAGEGSEAVEGFMKRVSIDFPVLIGEADSLANWSVRALPTTLIVNSQGKVVYEALGPREWDDETLLARVLELREPGEAAQSATTPD